MFCKNCGNQVADGATICPNCGVQLAAQPAQQIIVNATSSRASRVRDSGLCSCAYRFIHSVFCIAGFGSYSKHRGHRKGVQGGRRWQGSRNSGTCYQFARSDSRDIDAHGYFGNFGRNSVVGQRARIYDLVYTFH